MRECDGTKPVLVSTSRHVASPVFDVTQEKWDAAAHTLSGISRTVSGEEYELRIWAPLGFDCASVDGGTFEQVGSELRVKFNPSGEHLAWKVVFKAK
jgi:hypothetical protein